MFRVCPFDGDVSHWDLSSLREAKEVSSKFLDGTLGWLGVLQCEYPLPKDHQHAAQFHDLRALAAGLELEPIMAAQFIDQQLRNVVSLP